MANLTNEEVECREALNTLRVEAHENSVAHGFWGEGRDNDGEKVALIHSEVSEMLDIKREASDG